MWVVTRGYNLKESILQYCFRRCSMVSAPKLGYAVVCKTAIHHWLV